MVAPKLVNSLAKQSHQRLRCFPCFFSAILSLLTFSFASSFHVPSKTGYTPGEDPTDQETNSPRKPFLVTDFPGLSLDNVMSPAHV